MTGQESKNKSQGAHSPSDARKAIEGYEIIAKIGQGGMGAVYKAKQLSMDRIVAMKILLPSLARDVDFVHRFLREARAAGRLQHPNIVTGIDVGESNGYYYFAMEYVEGRTVSDLLDTSGKLDEKEAFRIASHMASALQQAHQRGLVHRDIKPENIMVTGNGTAKLMDLGLAKSVNEDVKVTAAGMAVGTPHYVSPEQARGEDDLDIRSDIYSLGATLYHMVTGSVPFDGKSGAVIMTKHLTDALEPPHHRDPDVSAGVSKVIQKMMGKEPEQRYQTPEELAEDINRVMAGKPPQVKTTGVRGRRLVDTDRADVMAVKGELARRERVKAGVKAAPARKMSPAAIAGIAAAGVAVLVIGFLLTRGGEEATAPDQGGKMTVPPGRSEKDERLQDMMDKAGKWEMDHSGDYEGTIARYEEVSREGIGTVWEMRAKDAAKSVRAKRKKVAEELFDEIAGRAERLAESGDYDAAISTFRKLPEGFEKILREGSKEAIETLKIDASTKITKGLEEAEKLFESARPDRGVAQLERISNIKYRPLTAKIAAARARLMKGKRDIAEMEHRRAKEAARKKLQSYWDRFDGKIWAGDGPGAEAVLGEADADADLKKAGSAVRRDDVLSGLKEVLAGFKEVSGAKPTLKSALKALAGSQVTLGTIGGEKTGRIIEVRDDAVVLEVAAGGTTITTHRIRFSNLTEKTRVRLVMPPEPKTRPGWMALAVICIGRKDVEVAARALLKVPESVLHPHYRAKVDVLKVAEVESAAKEFWEWKIDPFVTIELNERTGEMARQRMYEFLDKYGRTSFKKSVELKLDQLKKNISKALPYALPIEETGTLKKKSP